MDLGSTLGDLFGKGIDAYADIETAKRYAANGGAPSTRDAYGNAVPVGQGSFSALTQNPMFLPIALAAVALLVFLAVKK